MSSAFEPQGLDQRRPQSSSGAPATLPLFSLAILFPSPTFAPPTFRYLYPHHLTYTLVISILISYIILVTYVLVSYYSHHLTYILFRVSIVKDVGRGRDKPHVSYLQNGMMELVSGDHDGKDAVLARDARAELCTFERKRAESTAGEANHGFDVLALALGGITVLLTDLWYLWLPVISMDHRRY